MRKKVIIIIIIAVIVIIRVYNKYDYQVRCNMRTSPKVPSKVEVRSTPDICLFWCANALFRPVRNAPKSA